MILAPLIFRRPWYFGAFGGARAPVPHRARPPLDSDTLWPITENFDDMEAMFEEDGLTPGGWGEGKRRGVYLKIMKN